MSRRLGGQDLDRAAGGGVTLAHLRLLLGLSRLVHARLPLPELLERAAAALSEALGYRIVVFSLYRRAWDDLERVVVHADGDAAPTGQTTSLELWMKLLAPAYERHGCYFAPVFDWASWGGTYGIPNIPEPTDDDGWDPRDALSVPMRTGAGELLGVIGFDAPLSGRRPTDDQLRLLQAVAAHMATALEQVLDEEDRLRHERALASLLTISSDVTDADAVEGVMERVAAAIARTLDFDRVAIGLRTSETDELAVCAAIGWETVEPAELAAALRSVACVADGPAQLGGCYIASGRDVRARHGLGCSELASRRSGTGARAWKDELLVAPMIGPGGALIGVVWVDDPVDRCLPGRTRLQTLRMFANQATVAALAHSRFAAARYQAAHDELTGLANRRALVDALDRLTDGPPSELALLLLDLDHFKDLNDRRGHAAGDRGLVAVAAAIDRRLSPRDRAFRLGGDEFAVLLPDVGAEEAEALAARLSHDIRTLLVDGCRLEVSIGIACLPADGPDAQQLLRAADGSMYARKRAKLAPADKVRARRRGGRPAA